MSLLTAAQAKQMADIAKIDLSHNPGIARNYILARIEHVSFFGDQHGERYRIKFKMGEFESGSLPCTIKEIESVMQVIAILGFHVFHGINVETEKDFWNVSWG